MVIARVVCLKKNKKQLQIKVYESQDSLHAKNICYSVLEGIHEKVVS